MFGIMLQKMWHKRWMNLSLLLGCILLVATAVSFPLYQEAAYDRMLQDEFEHFVQTDGAWPTEFTMKIVSQKDKTGGTIAAMEKLLTEMYSELDVTERESIFLYTLAKNGIHSEMSRPDAEDLSVRLGCKSNLENHAEILSGRMYSESGLAEDGAIEVVISQGCMVAQGLLVDETIVFDALKGPDGSKLRMKIVGVYAEGDDYYWQEKEDELNNICMMRSDLFREMFTGENAGRYNINCNYIAMFEYSDLRASDIDYLYEKTNYYTKQSAYRSVISKPKYADVLDSYLLKKSRINATLTILQIPVLIMLAAFLLMISGQMYEMERNEISVIKSRGSSRGQIFRMYLYQGILLNLAGAAIGIPLGMALSKLLGSTRNFLVFDLSDSITIHFTKGAAMYAGGAVLLGLLCLTIPAIGHSRVSIVNLKQAKAMRKKPLWEKLFLDIILIGVAGYGYYNFTHNQADLAARVIKGEALDPLLYISSSLLIIGGGLLFLRLQPYLLQGIYTIGKKHWKPASFVSFMENVRNGRKQQLIMLFLIMTVSLGMYHSTVARTIVENACNNTEYRDGADLMIKEVWTEITDRDGKLTGEYVEPDISKYYDTTFIDGYTKVFNDESAVVSMSGNSKQNTVLMGVHTKEFGQITWVDESLNGEHYYNYLNELATVSDGALVSADYRDKLGFKEGDSINITTSKGASVKVEIVDFFDYWPGYAPTTSSIGSDGNVVTTNNYLVITHFDYLRNKLGQQPYEIWASFTDDAKESDIASWIQNYNVRLTKYVNRTEDLENTKNDPLLQGTNGVLTMGFVVTILLCGVGYLIYWIMAIRERELVFGVLRASGFHRGELFQMLINEQVFCGLLSILAGFGIGKLTSYLFVPILQQAYASTNQVLPLVLITNGTDLARLIIVISVVMIVCLAVLTCMLLRMNVAKALKLGEE